MDDAQDKAMLEGPQIILNLNRRHCCPFPQEGRDPIGAHIPLLVNWNIFFQFFPILQPACLDWHPPCVERHGPQTVSCQVHVALFGQLDLGFLAFLPGSSRLTCTQFTPPGRALLRTKCFCGASGKAAARGVNLYADMVAAC